MNPQAPSIVLFDGECNFCNASVNFVLDHEKDHSLRFAASGTPWAKGKLEGCGITERPRSIVLIEGEKCHTKSTAAIRLARYLKRPWSWLAYLILIPEPLRDGVYDWIAANRYRISGRMKQCRVPTEALRARFVGG